MMRRGSVLRGAPIAAMAALVVTACGARSKPAPGAPVHPSSADAALHGDPAQAGDAHGSPPGGAPVREYDLEPMRIEVVGTDAGGEPVLDAFDARSLLDQGNDALARGLPEEAMAHYEKLLAAFPDSSLAPAAHYNIGLAHEARGEHEAALARYRDLADQRGLGRDSVDAHKRMGAVLAELSRWTEARAALEALLARDDLTHADRIEGMARLGYVAIEHKDFPAAEAVLRDALAHHAKRTAAPETSYFVAMCHYYLAQIPHRQFQAIPMRLPDEQLRRDLDTKSELVRLAYDRYVETLQVRDVYWATAAGYQMSQIHKELWDHIVLAPVPTQLGPEAAAYYVQEVHAQVRVLLEKAMSGHMRNVELAEAYKTSTVWSDASRARAGEIAGILARETGGEAVKPEPTTDRASRAGAHEATSPAAGGYVPGRIDL